MGIWNGLRSVFGASAKINGHRKRLGLMETLLDNYNQLRRLAKQIDAHAENAPYPYVTQQLKQIAQEKDQEAGLLREKILKLGGHPQEVDLDLHSGKNHWARLVQDLEDEKDLEDQFLDDALRLGSENPEVGDLLRQLVTGKAFHRDALQNLAAKADPQASQS